MSKDLVSRIRDVRFTPVRLREGYEMGEVDQLLDQLEEAVSRGLTVHDLVDKAVFSQVRLREAYDVADVDGFLEEVQREAATRGSSVRPVEAGTASPPVIQEQRGLVSRLFRRSR